MSPLTPDHVNPERPWPQIDELAARTADGRVHAARAADDLPGVRAGAASRGSTRGCAAHVAALADPATGLAARTRARRAAVAGAGRRLRRPRAAPTCTSRSTRRAGTDDRRDDFDDVYGDWEALREQARIPPRSGSGSTPRCAAALRQAERDPAGLSDARRWRCCRPTAPALDALAALADELRATRSATR